MTKQEVQTVLVIAAHPDDEILGCGATMRKHVLQGDEVHVLILAEGITSRTSERQLSKNIASLSELAVAAQKANDVIGVHGLTLHNFPDNRMDSVDLIEVVKVVENAIQQVQPSLIYTHHGSDLNIDHQVTHQAVLTACRPLPGGKTQQILCFEVASSTEWQSLLLPPFVPNYFVDISDTLEAKLQALREYQMEMRPWPHARSVESLKHLAHWRGASIGRAAAEAFMVGRIIK